MSMPSQPPWMSANTSAHCRRQSEGGLGVCPGPRPAPGALGRSQSRSQAMISLPDPTRPGGACEIRVRAAAGRSVWARPVAGSPENRRFREWPSPRRYRSPRPALDSEALTLSCRARGRHRAPPGPCASSAT